VVTRRIAAWAGGLDELQGETLHPPIDGDVTHGDATLGQQISDIPIGQALPPSSSPEIAG
jgi:hypothetical protein